MSDEKDEGRMLIAINALIDGQKHTLRLVETAIDRYTAIETEVTKANRKLNAFSDLVIRNHGELSQRINAVRDLALSNHGNLSQGINAIEDLASRNHNEILLQFDSTQKRIDFVQMQIDSMQEEALQSQASIIGRLDALAARLDEVERLEDDRAGDIKKLRIELVSQYNDILTALQMASNSVLDTKEFRERLEQLERRLGL